MAKVYEKHLLRSARRMTEAQGDTLESLVSFGIKTSQAFSYLTKESGGVGSIGFLKRDAYNELSNRRNSVIKKGDAQSLVNHFKQKSNQEGLFFWDVELDDDGRIHNFFWRDGRSQIDYEFFGDVVVFYATYRTNKYNLICAPFIRVNHHWQTIMFACAFLSDETAESFEWAFRSFLESIDNKQPLTFMTDQDHAIMKAAKKVFPNSHHRLCLWHICKNAPSYLGGLNSDTGFQQLFHKCLTGCETIEEFEATWAKMINDYHLDGNKWLERLYNIQEKWCTCFSNDTFSAGFKTTSRSESTNSVLNGIGSKTTSLTKFVLEFERKLGEGRQHEAEADFICGHGKPPLAVKNSLILQQVARFYTHKLYKLFEKEFMGILASSHEVHVCGDCVYKFEVTVESKWGPKTSTVILNSEENVGRCSCKNFETMGILCTHSLTALKSKNLGTIPDAYFLKRWSKDARKHVSDYEQLKIFSMEGTNSDIIYTNRAMKFSYSLVTRSQTHEASRLIFWQGLESISTKLDAYFKKHALANSHSEVKNNVGVNVETTEAEQNEADITIQDPNRIRAKGRTRGERLKGHFEKRRRGGSSQKSNSTQEKRKKISTADENAQKLAEPSNETSLPLTGFPQATMGLEMESSLHASYSYPSFTSMLQGYIALNSNLGEDSNDAAFIDESDTLEEENPEMK